MKKIVIGILVLAMAGAAGFYAYSYFMKESRSLKAIVPGGAIGFVQFSDIQKNIEHVKETQLWQGLEEIDYDLIIQKSELSSSQRVFYQFLKEQVLSNTENPIVQNFFSRDAALVLYPVSISSLEMKQLTPQSMISIVNRIFSNLMLLTRVDPKVKFIDLFTGFLERFSDDVSVSKEKYKNKTFHLIKAEKIGLTFGLVRVDDVFVVGIGKRKIKEVIDVLKKEALSLDEDPNFKEIVKSFVDKPGLEMFFDLEKFFVLFKEQVEKLAQLNAKKTGSRAGKINEFFKGISGLKGVGVSGSLGEVDQIKMNVFFDERLLSPVVKQTFVSCSSSENKTISFVPENVLGYQWSSCLNLSSYWDQIKGEMSQDESGAGVKGRIKAFESKMNLSLEDDLIPALGDEFGGYLASIKTGGLFPIPRLLFFIEIKNREVIEKLFNKLSEFPFVVFNDEKYEGVPIRYVTSPIGNQISPGYCFLGNYFLLSVNKEELKESIEAFKNKKPSLVKNENFQEINFGLTDKNTNVQFVRVGDLIKSMRNLIQWGEKWFSTKDQKKQAFKNGTQRRFDELIEKIDLKQNQLKDQKESLVLLEDEIWNLESKAMDTTAKESELKALEEKINAHSAEIQEDLTQEEELKGVINGYDEKGLTSGQRALYLKEVLTPLLKSLESLQVYGMRATRKPNVFESRMFLKIK